MKPFDYAPGVYQGALFTSSSLEGLGNLKRPPAIGFFSGDPALPATGVAETRGEIFCLCYFAVAPIARRCRSK